MLKKYGLIFKSPVATVSPTRHSTANQPARRRQSSCSRVWQRRLVKNADTRICDVFILSSIGVLNGRPPDVLPETGGNRAIMMLCSVRVPRKLSKLYTFIRNSVQKTKREKKMEKNTVLTIPNTYTGIYIQHDKISDPTPYNRIKTHTLQR